jgi:hypothetical protein
MRFLNPWAVADSVAHFLYCPTMLGRRSARARWHHSIHLIPGRLLGWVCDRYDLSLGLTRDELYRTVPGGVLLSQSHAAVPDEVVERFGEAMAHRVNEP